MIVLRKKRIILTVYLILFTMLVGVTLHNRNEKNEIALVSALPVSNKVIVLDAGHGVPDERCTV